MTKLEVKAVVDIPPFLSYGRLLDGDHVFVDIEDVCAYLTTVAAAFDSAGAHSDISLSLRSIRDGITNPRVQVAP